jgi:hypothetical protein
MRAAPTSARSLLFHKSHFSVLATLEGGGSVDDDDDDADAEDGSGGGSGDASTDGTVPAAPAASPAAAAPPSSLSRLPLAVHVDGRAQPLPVRFLLPEEESEAAQEALLRRWLDVVPLCAPGLPPGVTGFALPLKSSTDSLMRMIEATVGGTADAPAPATGKR